MSNPALDIFIGLVFIYLLYSLLASIMQEIIARWFCLRARMLQKSIRRMLEDDNFKKDEYWKNTGLLSFFIALFDSLSRFIKPFREDEDRLLKKFYSHPTIKYLGEGEFNSKPSYLQASTFSQTLIQLLRGENYDGRNDNESNSIQNSLENNTLEIGDETRKHLRMLFADARGDAYLFRNKLEEWYNEMQDRTSGWYKRQNQFFLVLVGFFLACSFNIDSIVITKILLKDENARKNLVELAINRNNAYGVISDSIKVTKTYRKSFLKLDTTKSDPIIIDTTFVITDSVINSGPSDKYLDSVKQILLNDANLVQGILGLNALAKVTDSSNCKPLINFYDSLIAATNDPITKAKYVGQKENYLISCVSEYSRNMELQNSVFLKWIGWLITALAISLGAPFWFDLLSKLIQIRGAGTKPISSNQGTGGAGPASGGNPANDLNNQPIKG